MRYANTAGADSFHVIKLKGGGEAEFVSVAQTFSCKTLLQLPSGRVVKSGQRKIRPENRITKGLSICVSTDWHFWLVVIKIENLKYARIVLQGKDRTITAEKEKHFLNEFKKIHSIFYLHGILTPKKLSITWFKTIISVTPAKH